MKKIVILFLLSAIAFSGCNSPESKKKKEDAALKKRAEADLREDKRRRRFPGVRRPAEKGSGGARCEYAGVDDDGRFPLRGGWNAAEDRKGDGVFKYWDEHGLWTELDAILTERFAKKGEFWVAPPQFADESLNYDGYRVGIRRVGGSWKFVYFVNG